MKKIIVVKEGKEFDANVVFLMRNINNETRKTLIGVGISGSISSCRAIHAALYNEDAVQIYDPILDKYEELNTSKSYRRIEEIDGNICHMFAIPRSAIIGEFRNTLFESNKKGSLLIPERILIAPQGNIEEVIGQFLAETFGLPKKNLWSSHYSNLIPGDKIKKIHVDITDLAKEWRNMKAATILPMSETEVLKYIQKGIDSGILKIRKNSDNLNRAYFEEGMTTEDYLRKNALIISSKVDQYLKPRYDGRYLSKHLAKTKRISVPEQARAVMAIHAVLKEMPGAFLVGDMGTGKTQMSLATVYVAAKQREESGAKDGLRCLIVAPSNVNPKWEVSEIPKVLGNKKISITVINNTEDALTYVSKIKNGGIVPKGSIEFVLVSTDRMKLSAHGFVLGAKWNSYRYKWISPNTGLPLLPPNIKGSVDIAANWTDVVEEPEFPPSRAEIDAARKRSLLDPHGLPCGYVKKWRTAVRDFQDDYGNKKDCSLARPALKKYGETIFSDRWMIAEIFQRKLKHHFHLGIFDEIQQMKSLDSGRGLAFHKILKSCRKSIFLTGTLTNGLSSSILAILWRVFPREMLEHGFNHKTTVIKWANSYGVIEHSVTLEKDNTIGITTNRRSPKVIIKEKPGIAPQLISNHLLDKSVFIDLSDLNVPLVELEEKPIIIDLDEGHKDDYVSLDCELYNKCKDLQKTLGSRVWSKINPALLNYADQPSLGVDISFKDRDNTIVRAPIYDKNYYTSKERKLIKIITEELNNDRPCIIFNYYTGFYQTNERLAWVLKQHSIDSEILNERVSSQKRMEWLDKQVKKGVNVLIMNMKLVEVGLDLINYPTIIYFQLHDEVNTLRQSSRRAWRLGQPKKCKVYYLVNNHTQQMVQFQRLMSKRISAMIVEGRIERSDELAKYAELDLSVSSLTSDLSKMLQAAEIASAWESTAKKDIDKNLELVTEEEFQQRIIEAFENLTSETKYLCGVELSESFGTKNIESKPEFIQMDIDYFLSEIDKKTDPFNFKNMEQLTFF